MEWLFDLIKSTIGASLAFLGLARPKILALKAQKDTLEARLVSAIEGILALVNAQEKTRERFDEQSSLNFLQLYEQKAKSDDKINGLEKQVWELENRCKNLETRLNPRLELPDAQI